MKIKIDRNLSCMHLLCTSANCGCFPETTGPIIWVPYIICICMLQLYHIHLSTLLSGLYSLSSCDIGYASLGAIKATLCVLSGWVAIIRSRSYLHIVPSSICIRPSPFAFHCAALSVCLQQCLWAGHVSALVKGWERIDKKQEIKIQD